MARRKPFTPERRLAASQNYHLARAADELRADRHYDARNGGPPYVEPTPQEIVSRAEALFVLSQARKRERAARASLRSKLAQARVIPDKVTRSPFTGVQSLVRRILRKRYQADLAGLRGDQRKAERLRREADFLQRSLPAGVTLG